MKLILIALITFFGFLSLTEAQSSKSKISKEHRQELRQYFENQMYPVLKAEHDIFNKSLSAEDYNFLVTARKEAKALEAARKVLRKTVKAKLKEGSSKEEVKALFAVEIENLKAKRKSLGEVMRPFVERNKELIIQTVEVLKPYQENWKMDRKAIHQKYLPADHPRFQKMENQAQNEQGNKKNKRSRKKVLKFILWDGELKKRENLPENSQNVVSDEVDQNLSNLAPNFNISAYPNPTQSSTSIRFELAEQTELVFIKIVDLKGFIRLEIPLKKLNPGEHTLQVNLSGLEKGNYLYVVEVNGQQDSKSIVIQ